MFLKQCLVSGFAGSQRRLAHSEIVSNAFDGQSGIKEGKDNKILFFQTLLVFLSQSQYNVAVGGINGLFQGKDEAVIGPHLAQLFPE